MPRPTDLTVGVPVKNGGRLFEHLARHLADQRERCGLDVLVVDSGSTDGTVSVARRAGFDVHEIPPEAFGFGRTRNLIARRASRPLLAWVSADALPIVPRWPELFCEAFTDERVAGVYGRQVPRDANTMEMFFVAQNYPDERLVYTPDRIDAAHPRPGKVLFSNVFAAVRRRQLLDDPYPDDIEASEDQWYAWRRLEDGYRILYEPRAECLHAHPREPLPTLFRKTLHQGRALGAHGLDRASASFAEAARFLVEEVRYVVRHGHAHRLPGLLAHELTRWAGFQCGRLTARLPAARTAPSPLP